MATGWSHVAGERHDAVAVAAILAGGLMWLVGIHTPGLVIGWAGLMYATLLHLHAERVKAWYRGDAYDDDLWY